MSTETSDAGQQLLQFLQESFKSAQYTAKSVLAGLVFSLGGSIILFIIFCLIRPRNNIVYAPKNKYPESQDKKPEPLGKHPFSWMLSVFRMSDDRLVDFIGIDAVLYIKFMTMLRNIFLVLAVLGCLVMIPINVTYNAKSPLAPSVSKSDAFILMTPTLIYGTPLYAHIVLAYIFDFYILFMLWRTFNQVIQMRRNKFKTEEYQNALFMRTLMLTEVPKKYHSEDGLISLMGKLKISRPIQNATIGRDVKELTKLIQRHTKAVYKLESVLAKYLKNPEKLPAKRPVCRPFKFDTTAHKGKIDAIDYLCNIIEQLEKEIGMVRESIDTHKTLPYGFVSYESVEDCHVVAKSTQRKRKGKLNATLAPRPSDIIWDNIVLTRLQRANKQHWGNFLFLALMILWIAPNAFMGVFLSNLNRIGALWPPFTGFMYNYPIIFSILQGVLSPVVTSLIFLILPAIMRKMSQWQGKVTKHEREMDTTKKLYAFFVFNNLFIFTVFSVIWNIISKTIQLIKNGHDLTFDKVMDELNIAQQLSTSILGASSFWVMYILRVNFGAVLDLLQLFSLLWRGFQRHFLSPTPRELMLWTAPQHFNFAAYYNWLLFYATIALSFSMVQPLVLPVISFYFVLDVIFKKYSLMYIFVTKAESDGLYWPFLHNAMLFATGFGNLALFAVIWVQGGWIKAVCLGPLPVIIIIYKIVSVRVHNDRFYYFIPTEQENAEMESLRTRTNLSDISSGALERRYRNPTITGKLLMPMVHSKAQHILPQICNINNYYNEDAEMETAFKNLSDEYEGYHMNDLGHDGFENNDLLRRFDIVDENDLTFEKYQEIERERLKTPFNPFLQQQQPVNLYQHNYNSQQSLMGAQESGEYNAHYDMGSSNQGYSHYNDAASIRSQTPLNSVPSSITVYNNTPYNQQVEYQETAYHSPYHQQPHYQNSYQQQNQNSYPQQNQHYNPYEQQQQQQPQSRSVSDSVSYTSYNDGLGVFNPNASNLTLESDDQQRLLNRH